MQFTCAKDKLVEAVGNVSRAVSGKTNIPALEGILLRAQGDELTLTGYDLELGITTHISAHIEQEGELVVSAKLFSDMIRRLPGEELSLECDEKLLTQIKSGATVYSILGMPALDYPELPSLIEKESISIPSGTLKSMITQTLFAVATSDAKPVHTGSMFDVEPDKITLVAVDGYRMALRREAIQTGQDIRFIVPGKTLSEISKLLEEDDTPIEMQFSRRHIIFQIGAYEVISRLLEGEFLNYGAAIPQTSTSTVLVSTRALIESIERTSLLISDRLKSPLRVRFTDGMISLSCTTALGRAYDELSCNLIGSEEEIGFNNRYLLDALRAVDGDQLKLELGGPLSPMKVVPLEGDGYLFLVLPVRLKSE